MGPQSYTEMPYVTQSSAEPPSEPRRRGLLHRGWRKMTWVLIAYSALVVVGGLALAGHTMKQDTSACQNGLGGGSVCQQLAGQDSAAQFEHILKLGVVGFVILSIIWFMTRPQGQASA